MRRAVGQADGEILERPLLDHEANCLKRREVLIETDRP